jgi:4-hydroxybenzoyl-CoA reductase subunit alpha
MGDYTVLNKKVPRLDSYEKTTGRARYVDDLTMQGMLHGAILQSPLAHAKILHMDISRAKKLPGVKALVTAEDVGPVKYGVSPARYDETLFCQEKVRYVGDEIAAVAAVDTETAMEAVSIIKVDYEDLPAVFTIEDGLSEGAPVLHEDYPQNICAQVHQEFGDVEAAFHDCGFAINLTAVEGQMEGSISMGLGEAMFEEVKFDEKGRIFNSNLSEYKIPTALDMPEVKSLIVESHEPNGPFGAKEVGEGAIMPAIPAILNAIYDATGVLIQELPLTPERVYAALKAHHSPFPPEG